MMTSAPSDLTAFIEEHYPLLVDILQTDNPPGEEGALRGLMRDELKNMGAKVKIDTAGNLMGFFGDGPDAILLGGHLDSVMPCKGVVVVREGNILRSDGKTNLCSDDGAGIFEVLMAIRYLQHKKKKFPSVDVLFTVGEEVGGKGVKQLDVSHLRACHGILLDRAAPPGTVVVAAPYKSNFRVTCRGIGVHALEAEAGISAIHMAAHCIEKFPQGRINDNTTANIGKVWGGEAVNKVPERVVLEGEVRSFSSLEIEEVIEEYTRVIGKLAETIARPGEAIPSIELEYTERREGYEHSKDLPIIRTLCDIHDRLGIETNMQVARGCSDAGELTNKGITTVNYGYGGNRIHSREEWIDMEDIARTVWVITELLQTAECPMK